MIDAYQKLLAGLSALRLDAMRGSLDNVIDRINSGELTFMEGLSVLVQIQVAESQRRRVESVISTAHFPSRMTFDSFDFSFQPELNRNEVLDLKTLRFMDTCSNVIFLGLPGVGKTHLAVAAGMEAASQGRTVYFINCLDLIASLKKAQSENRLEYKLRNYASYSLLIIDEVGFLPMDREAGNLMFQLIARRYEKKSTIITSNKSLSTWGELFGESMVANAILDRLVHHSKIFRITGPSFRTKGLTKDAASASLPPIGGNDKH